LQESSQRTFWSNNQSNSYAKPRDNMGLWEKKKRSNYTDKEEKGM